MFSIHVLRFSLLTTASEKNGQWDSLLSYLQQAEDQISQHIDFLSMITGHFALSEECLQEKIILPVFEKISKDFPHQKVLRRLSQMCSEKEMSTLAQALNRLEKAVGSNASLPPTQLINSDQKPRALKSMVPLPLRHQSGTNVQASNFQQPLIEKCKPINQEFTQNKENTDNQQTNKVSFDRKVAFFESFIKPHKQERPLEKINHNEKAKRQLKVTSFNDRDKNSSKDSKKLAPRYTRIIKQAHKFKPMLRPIDDNTHVVSAQTLSFTNLQKMKMSFADFADFSENENAIFGSLTTQPTFEDSHNELQSGNSNCFNHTEETHSIDFDALNDGVIAMRTPIKLPDPVDTGMPALNLDD